MIFRRLTAIILLISFAVTCGVCPTAFAATAGDISVYINSYGNNGFPVPNFSNKTDTKTEWATGPDGVNCLHFVQKGTNDAFCDAYVGVEESSFLVMQIDIYPVSLEGGKLMVRAVDSSSYSNIITTNTSGNLIVGTTVIQALETGVWTTVAVISDYENLTANVYINGSLKKKAVPLHNGAVLPSKLRIGFQSVKETGNNEVYFNRLKVYEGSALRELDESHLIGDDALVSINDSREMAVRKLGGDAVYMAHGDFYYQNGHKLKYSETNTPPSYLTESGTVMTPAELISEGLGKEIIFDSSTGKITANNMTLTVGSTEFSGGQALDEPPLCKDGVLYLPASSFAKNVFEKYTYEDVRGFVLISDKDRAYSNSDIPTDNLEPIDMVYRYLQYERPTGDRIYEDFIKHSKNKHPRIYVCGESEELRTKIANNPDLKNGADELLEKCDSYLQIPPTEYNIPDGLRLFAACENVTEVITDLYTAYLLTGNEKYRERLWLEMENALNWNDWNVQNHYLDSGEIAPGISLGYDILHDYLTEDEKAWVRNRLVDLYLDSATGVYTGSFYHNGKNGKMTGTNWGAVLASGMLMTALSFMDSEPEDSLFTKKCKFIAENALQTLEYSIGNMFPDGAISEGIGYWTYYVKHITAAITTLQNTCGTDYGLLASPGFREAMDYALYIQTKNGCYNFSATSGEGNVFHGALFKIAQFYGDYEKMSVLNAFRKQIGKKIDAQMILWYNPVDIEKDFTAYPLDKFFAGENITTARSSWTNPEGAYLGVRGGKNDSDGQFDKGSFIYENQGVRWFVDLGKENQNIKGGYYGEAGWTLYRHRTEGHNAVVINPTADDPGQTSDGVATLKKFESKPRGVIAVYDLSDVYADDVNHFDRGFYFGENRSTLVVRDEIELKEEENDIYMFLHTKGKITLGSDGKSAIIEKDGKKIKADVICDASEWSLSVDEAESLFHENTRADEISRSDVQRLTLTAKTDTKLNISTKIIPYEDGNTYENHTFAPCSEWVIADGELARDLTPEILSPLVLNADADGIAKVKVRIPYKPDMAQLYVNNKLIHTQTEFDIFEDWEFAVDTKDVEAPNLVFEIRTVYGDDEYFQIKDFILEREDEKKEVFSCDFSGIDNSKINTELKNRGFTSIITKDGHIALDTADEALQIVISDTRTTNCGYIEKNNFSLFYGQIMRLSFDIESDSSSHMFFSSRGTDKLGGKPSILSIPTGKNGRLEMTLDGETYNTCIKDKAGNILYESGGSYKINGFSLMRLSFSASKAGSMIKISDLCVESLPKQHITGITRQNGKIRISLYDGADKITAVSYDGNKLSAIYFPDENCIEFPDDKATKVFVWDSGVRPLKKYLQFQLF